MSFEIRFTFEAEETYKAVVAQLLERWGNKFVIKFQTKIYKSLENISKSPYIYPIAEENTGIRKCILHKNCSLLYKIFDDRVEIICFWDNRQDPLIIF
jgi:hypothetical protein